MKVWVVMGNDYPSGVFSSEDLANKHIDHQKAKLAKQQEHLDKYMRPRIYWRATEFNLDGEE